MVLQNSKNIHFRKELATGEFKLMHHVSEKKFGIHLLKHIYPKRIRLKV